MEPSELTTPIPLSEIENVLEWVDSYKLSRSTKKINRDFADAEKFGCDPITVLLAEILQVHYPKLVEMHNYPPRNSQSLKLYNWNTLNKKVLKKLKIGLPMKTLEQLSNSVPGLIERVLIMIRDKVKRDDEAKLAKESSDNNNSSSGGSYYDTNYEDDQVLVVPIKHRNNGILEIVQKRVVSLEAYMCVKEDLKDAKEALGTLKQKVEHMENIIKLKENRIEELQNQLERKVSRKKITEEEEKPSKTQLSSPGLTKSLPVTPKASSILVVANRSASQLEDKKSPTEVASIHDVIAKEAESIKELIAEPPPPADCDVDEFVSC